jgi:5-methylcytosine-specific restriction endonuclease McrA
MGIRSRRRRFPTERTTQYRCHLSQDVAHRVLRHQAMQLGNIFRLRRSNCFYQSNFIKVTMPIKPENRHYYQGPAWKAVRASILKRACNSCEFCGVMNGQMYIRDAREPARVVLTIAHLNHNPADNRPSNLRALCQRCHLKYDQQHHNENRRLTLAAKKAHAQQIQSP